MLRKWAVYSCNNFTVAEGEAFIVVEIRVQIGDKKVGRKARGVKGRIEEKRW